MPFTMNTHSAIKLEQIFNLPFLTYSHHGFRNLQPDSPLWWGEPWKLPSQDSGTLASYASEPLEDLKFLFKRTKDK